MVRGLTRFISQRMDLFMNDYEFPHNSILLIDGDVIAVNIYLQTETRNSWFGGDCDIYANAIRDFFKKLFACKVIPYVLFDGVTGPTNLKNPLDRLRERIKKTVEISKLKDHKNDFLPFFVNEVFNGIVKELNIKMVMCDSDCDNDIASIANKLNCPVLSNDSDFFIYDVKYVPFVLQDDELNLYVHRKIEKHEVNKYLKCMMFNRNSFLKKTGLVTLDRLPILTIYLGNSYIEKKINFQTNTMEFRKYLRLMRGNYTNNIINWLAKKKHKDAVEIIVKYFKDKSTQEIMEVLIKDVINEYTLKESCYFKYLTDSEGIETDDDDDYASSNGLPENIPSTFINKYRKGCYHHYLLNIIAFHRYYPKPLVEDINQDSSHKLSFPIISAIHKILSDNSAENLLFYGRVGEDVSEQIVPKYEKDLPNYNQLQEMNDEDRLHYFFKILCIEEEFKKNCLELFPESWHLLLVTLKYMSHTTKIKESLIYSLVITKIMLSYIDKKLGFIRTAQDFDRIASQYNRKSDDIKDEVAEFFHVSQALEQLSMIDSVNALGNLLPYFEISSETSNDDAVFNINLIHSMSEFQSCLLHVEFLNELFCMPFTTCLIWECYNGTFIYNIFSQLENDHDFICNLLVDSPTILRCFVFVVTLLKAHIS